MKLEFHADDFNIVSGNEANTFLIRAAAAANANAKLREWLEAAPVVFALQYEDAESYRGWQPFHQPGFDTHRARLIEIEEMGEDKYKCLRCGDEGRIYGDFITAEGLNEIPCPECRGKEKEKP